MICPHFPQCKWNGPRWYPVRPSSEQSRFGFRLPFLFFGASFVCTGTISRQEYTDIDDIPLMFIGSTGEVIPCGPNLSPLPPFENTDPTRDDLLYSSHNLDSNVTSSR